MSSKWCLITGVSAGGLGDALTAELLSRDINVIATGEQLTHLDYLSAPPNSSTKLEKLYLDVTSALSISAAVTETRRITGGTLDILVNNAGYGYMMPLIDADIDTVKRNFDVNVFGLLAVTQAFFPLLKEAKGMVVNQASIAGLPGLNGPYIGSYSASKTAVIDLGNTLRIELKPFDIKVVSLVTGDVRTEFWNNARGAHVGIPSSSPYQLIKESVEKTMRGETNPPGQHTRERWAKAVVHDLLKSSAPSHIRRGWLSTTMLLVTTLFPTWVVGWLQYQNTDLAKLKQALDAQENKKEQ